MEAMVSYRPVIRSVLKAAILASEVFLEWRDALDDIASDLMDRFSDGGRA
jgi:hypothetical protein